MLRSSRTACARAAMKRGRCAVSSCQADPSGAYPASHASTPCARASAISRLTCAGSRAASKSRCVSRPSGVRTASKMRSAPRTPSEPPARATEIVYQLPIAHTAP